MPETAVPDPSVWLFFGDDFERLRRQLADARARGETSTTHGPRLSMRRISRRGTRAAAKQTRAAWKRAYRGAPPTLGDARVASLLGELDRAWAESA